jgi:outer membrane protein assembly factor BamA
VQALYRARRGPSTISAEVHYGRITGTAPLFERFTLGDSSTLRGWNKYEIAPAGADRMMYQSLEYRFKNLAWFVDTGSVWAPGEDRTFRVSTGIGVHAEHAHITVGVPVNGDRAAGKLIVGIWF